MEVNLLPFFEILTYLSMIFLALYSAVLGYHWFTYGANPGTSMTLMIVYVLGSVLLLIAMASTLTFF